MKKEWDKAVKMLKGFAGERTSLLKAEVWPSGMDEKHEKIRYNAYVEDLGHSNWFSSPIDAVKDIMNKG